MLTDLRKENTLDTSSRSIKTGRYDIEVPSDWPDVDGLIDLTVHDLPHTSSSLEWWYVNSHFETADGQELALFAAFFREFKGRDSLTNEPEYAHSITWALSDATKEKFYPYSAVDLGSPEFALRKLATGAGVEDERLNRAMREVFLRGRIPTPTQMFKEAKVQIDRLELDYEGNRFSKDDDGTYELHIYDANTKTGCDLTFKPKKPPTRHGNNGICHGVANEIMFYYLIPRCELKGNIIVEGRNFPLRQGTGWYDHEFGFIPKEEIVPIKSNNSLTAWNWASIQLENDVDVTIYSITRIATGEVLDNYVIISDEQGNRRQFNHGISFYPVTVWSSTRSFVEYPINWVLKVPGANLDLCLDATFADQEVITVISNPGFWEGVVKVNGYYESHMVTGRGWVERKGFRFNQLDEFFKAVSKEVRRQVSKVLPCDHRPGDDMRQLVVRHSEDPNTQDIDLTQLYNTLVKPIREIIDRGGKAWRSYAALVCIDAVGGDSREYLHWLALPEILHVGSLIVDDVEDRSDLRRGGLSSHKIYGEPTAINAGTAAYFLCEPNMAGLPTETKIRIYQLYFDCMRAGHAGQAIDINGLAEFVTEVIKTGNANELERRVLAIHRLKTAVPAGMSARIGAILGRGTNPQIEGLGKFFESVGLAFQIIDDVLNLRGFQGDLKQRGEDIQQGKLTLPVVKGLGLLSLEDRYWLWNMLSSNPNDLRIVTKIIDMLESVGAIDDCIHQAEKLVESAWANLEPILPDSQYKVMLRAFGWYVLERQY